MTDIFPADHEITQRTFWVSFGQQIATTYSQFLHVFGPNKFPRTNLRILMDHKWSVDRSSGNTAIECVSCLD